MRQTAWFKQAIIYQILIDRFAGVTTAENWQNPAFIGGNLKAIINHLPYLQELGINTVWISPFYETSAYHGYHITDFFKIDPHFGTEADLKELIAACHQKNMHIIADFVPNHCSRLHPFFQAARQDKQSLYFDWFYFTRWPDHYLSFLSVTEIPKLNLENPQTEAHIMEAAVYWLKMGLDGFRLDHVIGVSHRFWKRFSAEMKAITPHSVCFGEAWMMGIKWRELSTLRLRQKYLKRWFGSASDFLLKSYQNELDGVLDFTFSEIMRRTIHQQPYPAEAIEKRLNKHYQKYNPNYFLPSFLDNHDMDRFLFVCGNDLEKFKKAVTIQFQQPMPPIIYYGSESGLRQPQSMWDIPHHGDLQARQPMNWNHIDPDIFLFYQTLIKNRTSRI